MTETARYHVRALDRSLAILRMLNQHNGLVAAELSRLVDLPRPTVLRLLNTLSEAGYVVRSDCDNRYRATRKLRELSCGYEEETWLRNVVQPFLAELEQEVVWPLAAIRLHGQTLIVEALTDHGSQMVERRDSPGIELAPLASSCGYLYMALLPPAKGQAFMAHAIAHGAETLARIGMSVDDVKAKVDEIRRHRYCALHFQSHSALSVPVYLGRELFCGLNMRMHGSIEARRLILGDYIEDLHAGAAAL